MVARSYDKSIIAWDVQSGNVAQCWTTQGLVQALAITSSYSTGNGSGGRGSPKASMGAKGSMGSASGLAAGAYGVTDRVFVGTSAPFLESVDLRSDKQAVTSWAAPNGAGITALQAFPGGTHVASADPSGCISIWSVLSAHKHTAPLARILPSF